MNEIKKERKSALTRASLFIIGLLLLVGSVGCSGKKHVYFHITPDVDANNGRPLYVLVREVNKKMFLTEYYDDVAALLHAENRNEALLGWALIVPGESNEFKVTRPEGSDIAVYGMFTEPGTNWKMRVQVPLRKSYTISVQGNNLVETFDEDEKKDDDA